MFGNTFFSLQYSKIIFIRFISHRSLSHVVRIAVFMRRLNIRVAGCYLRNLSRVEFFYRNIFHLKFGESLTRVQAKIIAAGMKEEESNHDRISTELYRFSCTIRNINISDIPKTA